jgi:NAD(P)-dependent dehydrogenase (short-subunit alcohol dehydrogenase family)
VRTLTLDVTERAAAFDAVKRAAHFGRLDVIVNIAG